MKRKSVCLQCTEEMPDIQSDPMLIMSRIAKVLNMNMECGEQEDERWVDTLRYYLYDLHIHGFEKVSLYCFLYSADYMKRVKDSVMSKQNLMRWFYVGMVLATKYIEDDIHSNQHYADTCSTRLADFNTLEAKIFQLLDYDVSVSSERLAELIESLGDDVTIRGSVEFF